MATYIDETYYTDTYKGFTVPSNQFPFYSERAAEMMDFITGDSIRKLETEDPDEYALILDNIKKCNCASMDIMYEDKNIITKIN